MRLAAIGVGQAGGKVLDQLLEYDRRWGGGFVTSATAINTARTDLHGLERVPSENRILIGQTITRGHGTGADNELGAKIADRDRSEIRGALDAISLPETEAFLVIAGLGGGTGSGAGPVVAQTLSETYREPVYTLGIMPAELEGGIYSLNASRSLKTFVRESDNVLLFDNDAWRSPGESIESGYARMNDEIARRIGVLFSVGEWTLDRVGQSVVDASEIRNTLATGGLTTIGYAADSIEHHRQGLLDRFRNNDGTQVPEDLTDQIVSLVRAATNGRLTAPAAVESANRVLLIVSGPAEYLSRRGSEEGRRWLAEVTGSTEVRGGDQPVPDQDRVAATVVLAGVTEVPRIREMQALGIETTHDSEERGAKRQSELNALMTDEQDLLDPLF